MLADKDLKRIKEIKYRLPENREFNDLRNKLKKSIRELIELLEYYTKRADAGLGIIQDIRIKSEQRSYEYQKNRNS